MTRPSDGTLSAELAELITDQGLEALPEVIRIIINAAMQAERQRHLQAAAYERTPERQGYANGYKPHPPAGTRVTTRVGAVTFAVPQVRDGDFYPTALEKGLRSERALTLALAEMYVQGVSTRRVAAITEQLCGIALSSSQVSRAAAQLDPILEQWRTRPLGVSTYLALDARYEKVRVDGQVRDAAVLLAMGVQADGKRTILGVSVALSEQEVHWRTFLHSLVARGLTGVQLIVSDAHEGLQAARKAVFGGVPWQRCQFHLQQNASAYVPRQELKAEVAADIRAIFTAPTLSDAQSLLTRTVDKYAKTTAPKLATWLETAIPQGLTVFAFPAAHRQRLRTVNGLERLNQELRRRTRVVGIFPNEASCLRLVTALAMETSDDWAAGKVYLSLTA
jgi:putative transposase